MSVILEGSKNGTKVMHLLSLAGDRLRRGQDNFTSGSLRPWLQAGTWGRGLLRTTGRQKRDKYQKMTLYSGHTILCHIYITYAYTSLFS